MTTDHASAARGAGPLVVWLLAGALATLLVSAISFALQQNDMAPAGILPLASGAAIGAASAAAYRAPRKSHTPLVIGGVLWAIMVLPLEERLAYTRYSRVWNEATSRDPRVAAALGPSGMQPTGFVEFAAARFRRQPGWWIAEALLSALGALVASSYVARQRVGRNSLKQPEG